MKQALKHFVAPVIFVTAPIALFIYVVNWIFDHKPKILEYASYIVLVILVLFVLWVIGRLLLDVFFPKFLDPPPPFGMPPMPPPPKLPKLSKFERIMLGIDDKD
jgi:hypothetical protein